MNKSKFIRTKFPTLEEMHSQWEVNCLPPDLPHVQHVEMKKAFMAGVASMFHVLKYEIPEVSDDEGIGYLNRIDAALTKFFTEDIYKLPR